MKGKKYIINAIVLIVLIVGTAYFILRDQNMDELFMYIRQAKKRWLIIGLMFVLVFISFESIIIHYLMKSLSYSIRFIHCLKYSFIGFFVSAITPSATGGQPAQLYFMGGDGVSVAVSSLVLMVVTIAYKAVLLFLAGIMFISEYSFVMAHISNIIVILVFGIVVNIFMIAFLMIVIFKQSFAKKIVGNTILFLGKHRIIKNHQKLLKRLLIAIEKYEKGAEYLKTHKLVFFNVFVITMVQRIALFAVTYAVYKAFGLSGCSFFEIVTLQLIISLAVDNLPLPGGLGASEGIFMVFFEEIFTTQFITAGLLLSRGLSYYAVIILGGVVTGLAWLTRKRRVKEQN